MIGFDELLHRSGPIELFNKARNLDGLGAGSLGRYIDKEGIFGVRVKTCDGMARCACSYSDPKYETSYFSRCVRARWVQNFYCDPKYSGYPK